MRRQSVVPAVASPNEGAAAEGERSGQQGKLSLLSESETWVNLR